MAAQNANPIVYAIRSDDMNTWEKIDLSYGGDEETREEITSAELFSIVRGLQDPEHPLTLEQLNVVSEELITVNDIKGEVDLKFTPTIPHCSMATLIGLSLRVKLLRSLPSRFKVRVQITPGAHASELAINKQLNDKERVAAALENSHLRAIVDKCILAPDVASAV